MLTYSIQVVVSHEAGSSIGSLVTGMAGHGTEEEGPKTKTCITHSFFELQIPDLAWKFLWTVQTNYKSTKRNTKYS